MVPLNNELLFIDLFARWRLPVILVARTRLGTINHSLLSIEALKRRNIEVHGIAFVGEAEEAVEQTIAQMGSVRRLGRLPLIEPIDSASLKQAFAENFRSEDFGP
jgi:dethiobiotin synthetase